MLATVWRVRVQRGDIVTAGDELLVLESMKMEIPVTSPASGTVRAIHVEQGQHVDDGDLLLELG